MNLKTLSKRVLDASDPRSRANLTAGEHVRGCIQSLTSLLELGSLDVEDRRDLRTGIYQLWLALRELEKGNA